MELDRWNPPRKYAKLLTWKLASSVLYAETHRSRGLPPPRPRCGAFFLFALIVGCAGKPPAAPRPPAAITREGGPFAATLRADHALAGRIWSRTRNTFIDRATLESELAIARFVLLGEKHDAPDHHRLQRELIAAIVSRGRKPAIVFEMLEVDAQEKLDAARANGADAIADATAWNKSGWDWPLYRPIVSFALDQKLPILAGNYPRAKFMGVPMDVEDVKRLGAALPYPEGEEARLRAELMASHCGMLTEERLPKMVTIQRLRDGQMAERMVSAEQADSVALIAGSGHVRTDRGVPWVLHQRAPNAKTFSLAFVEVEAGLDTPARYATGFHAAALPFDAVWFTPALADEDPCAKMK